MKPTEERMIPEYSNGQEIYLEHISRYKFASQFVKNKVVLDIACGSGYGARELLKFGAQKVIGVDISKEAISYCKKKYRNKDITFIIGDVGKIPLDDKSVDIITSFETLEHVDGCGQKVFLKEIKRVLKQDGQFIVSTPNTIVFPKGNIFHKKELKPDEFENLLKKFFLNIKFFFQDDFESSLIFSKQYFKSNKKDINEKIVLNNIGRVSQYKSMYLIGVCSNENFTKIIKNNLTISDIQTWKYVFNINNLNQMIQRKDKEIVNLNQVIQQKDKKLKKLNQLIQSKNQKTIELGEEVKRMKMSKFWKLRERYMKFKGLNFIYFIDLVKKASIVLKRDGAFVFLRSIYKYLIHGRGYFASKINFSVARQDDAWKKYRKTFNQEIKPLIVRKVAEMNFKPLISIIVPTYNTPETMLKEMIESVKNQLYPNWELCISDDGSNQPHIKKILKKYASDDSRIKLLFNPDNKGVSYASNRALELATGDFVVLLDHDDIIEEQALFRVAESILKDNPDMIYSDEVEVTPDAAIVKKYVYRPAFSREFLRGHPYIVHMIGFKKKLLQDIGGFDEKLKISQDYDLILRASEKAQIIVHIPEILYRWRIHGSSSGHQKMSQVMDISKNILQRHIERCGDSGTVRDGHAFNLFDVRYDLNDNLRVAIIIPTKNNGNLVRKCVESIQKTILEVQYDIIIIDHESDDLVTRKYLTSISSNIQVLHYTGAFNFSAMNNWAVSQISADDYSHYLFCNNDIEAIKPGWLERMLELGQQPSIGIVGAKLLYPDHRTIQHAGVCVGAFDRAEHYGKFLHLPKSGTEFGYFYNLVINHEVSAVTAACLLIRKDVFEEISGFDENIAVGFGDVDLCLRSGKHKYKTVFCPYAELIHHESYTRGISEEDTHPKDTALYKSKWKKTLQIGDPYYNPGLSLKSTTWQIKYPLNYDINGHRRIVKQDKDGKGQLFFS